MLPFGSSVPTQVKCRTTVVNGHGMPSNGKNAWRVVVEKGWHAIFNTTYDLKLNIYNSPPIATLKEARPRVSLFWLFYPIHVNPFSQGKRRIATHDNK